MSKAPKSSIADPTIPPAKLTASITSKIRTIDREMKRHSAGIAEAVGVGYTEGLFLRIVADNPGSRLNVIAEIMNLTQGASSNIKRELVKRGLIVDRAVLEDRRAISLYVTSEGQAAVERGKNRSHQSVLGAAAQGMTLDELTQLDYLLGRLTDRIDELNAQAESDKKNKA